MFVVICFTTWQEAGCDKQVAGYNYGDVRFLVATASLRYQLDLEMTYLAIHEHQWAPLPRMRTWRL